MRAVWRLSRIISPCSIAFRSSSRTTFFNSGTSGKSAQSPGGSKLKEAYKRQSSFGGFLSRNRNDFASGSKCQSWGTSKRNAPRPATKIRVPGFDSQLWSSFSSRVSLIHWRLCFLRLDIATPSVELLLILP